MDTSGLYIHVPFCRKKCLYCDFYTGGLRIADWRLYTERLLEELKSRVEELPGITDTLYIGGGTPSLMPEVEIRGLTDGIRGILGERLQAEEFTIEVNPEDVTEEKCRVWKECGVNRISMGVQSFDAGILRNIGRGHTPETSENAYRLLREYFNNVGIDLIFGLPGQDLGIWEDSVDKAMKLNPEHISAYSLMLEDGTAMTRLCEEGRVRLPDEDESAAMFYWLTHMAGENGYKRYEISNYSKPGYESRHNSGYWKGKPYLGLGPSAHSYDGESMRRWNEPDLKGYMEKGWKGCEDERLTEEEMAEEMLMLSLRMSEGLDYEAFGRKFGEARKGTVLINAQPGIDRGELDISEGRLRLTDKGVMVADKVFVELMM